MSYDPATPAGTVRLLIPDNDPLNEVFTDVEVQAFLTLEGGSTRLAAAQALDTLASNEAMVSKVIRSQDLATDGAKVAAELRARAVELRRQDDTAVEGEGDGVFDVVEFDAYADGYHGFQVWR